MNKKICQQWIKIWLLIFKCENLDYTVPSPPSFLP